MKKKNITKRFLAVCVCLIIVLSACASIDAPSDNSTSTEESKATSALELSEVNAESTSSEAEPSEEVSESESSAPDEHISADDNASLAGDITITPVEPVIPEERETTLEKVLSFDIGIDGMFQYDFLFHDDPSDAMMICPGKVYTDGKGTFYHTLGSKLVCLNDGVWIPDVNWTHIEDIEIIGDALYLLRLDGSVEHYDISAGFGNPTLKSEYQVYDSDADEWGTLLTLGEKEPIFFSDKNEIFTLSKEPINDKDAPFLFQSGIQAVTVENGAFVIPADDKKNELSAISDAVLWTTAYYDGDDTECLKYGQNGNLVSRVLIDVEYHGNDTPCKVEFEHAGVRYTLETYLSCQVVIGKTVFEELLQSRVFYDFYGTMYLAAYYTDHCDIYRVNAGYTSAEIGEPTPERAVPEERETTLEKVLSFDIGIDGMFQYSMLYYDDPSTAFVGVPGEIYVGTDNKLYHYVNNSSMSRLICLNDGTYMEVHYGTDLKDAAICGDTLYLLVMAGDVYQYDISDGLGNAVLQKEYSVYEQYRDDGEYGRLVFLGMEDPIFRTANGKFYTLEKKLLQETDLPFAFSDGEKMRAEVQMSDGDIPKWVIDSDSTQVIMANSEQIFVIAKGMPSGVGLISSYDKNANPVSRFLCLTDYNGEKIPCEIAFDHCGLNGVVKEYMSQTFSLGKNVFEQILNYSLFLAPDGVWYLAIYYTDHCDIYRVNAGYTSEAVTEKTETMEDGSGIVPTNSAGESGVTDIQWLGLSRGDVETNAIGIITECWVIRDGNLEVRTSDVVLPRYLDKKLGSVSNNQVGIPYCKGGYHGKDEFATTAGMRVDNKGGPTTGNIKDVDGNITSTIGLDCARFVCKAIQYSSTNEVYNDWGLSPDEFIDEHIDIGHWYPQSETNDEIIAEVASIVLQKWDVIVCDTHAMFYSRTEDVIDGHGNVKKIVHVYDTTSVGFNNKTMERSTGYTIEELALQGYKFAHLYSEYDHNATHHWTQCASCGSNRSANEPHQFEDQTISSVRHKHICVECGYYVTQTHTYEYESVSETKHKGTCTACGYTVTRSHNLSYNKNLAGHWQTCSLCEYTSDPDLHSFDYTYNLTQHWEVCEICEFAKAKSAHTYNIYGVCTVCGYRGTIRNSDAPDLPIDDFVVLCVDFKEELWENVQR